jgi:hypothetical protein
MDPLQRSYSRRSLLPVEQQIIDALGLTIEEYWEFCRLADCKAKERGEAYRLVPDISCLELKAAEVLFQIAVSLLFTAASILLAPKPPPFTQEDSLSPIRTADARGQTKFAELFGFDSAQDLATLGSIIPLVFARREKLPGSSETVGGIRVKGLLLWSQLLSLGSHQELKMLTTLGLSSLAAIPDPQGLAIGDQLLRNYQEARYRAYFKNNPSRGGRVNTINTIAGDLPAESEGDVFEAFDPLKNNLQPLLSGTRTPNSQRSFGCHSPISNGAPYFLPYDIVQIFDNDVSLRTKRDKINGLFFNEGAPNVRPYPGRQAMERLNNSIVSGTNQINVGDTLIFRNSAARENPEEFAPHGLDDVNTAIDSRMSDTDVLVNVGDLFAFGSSIIQCIKRPEVPFESPQVEDRQFEFVCKEQGFGYFQSADADALAVSNAPFGQHLQRVDIATITNNRKCDQTEIGIKSTVFKRIDNFANVNSEPPAEILEQYEEDKQAFSLGKVSTFQTRYSFFRIEFREVGLSNDTSFRDLSAGQIFAVRGSTPQPQYNTIRITHDPGQYEFRIVPIPGSTADGLYVDTSAQSNNVQLLSGTGNSAIHAGGNIYVSYTGRPTKITDLTASNDEFFFKRVEAGTSVVGAVNNLDLYTVGDLPDNSRWELEEGPFVVQNNETAELTTGVYVNVDNPNEPGAVFARWEGEPVEIGAIYRYDLNDFVKEVPAVKGDWQTEEQGRRVLDSGPNGNDSYVQLDSGGAFKFAFFDGENVSDQTQRPSPAERNDDARYRIVPDSDPIVGSVTSFDLIPGITFQDDKFDPDRYNPYKDENNQNGLSLYYGVWETVTGDNAFFDGLLVSDQYRTTRDPSVAGIQYIRGDFVRTDGETKVYGIIKINNIIIADNNYYYPIEKGEYKTERAALNLYKIAKYKFSLGEGDFVSGGGPTDYSHQSYTGNGSGFKVNASSFAVGQWQWVIVSSGSGYAVGDTVRFQFADGTEVDVTVTEIDSVFVQGKKRTLLNLKDAIADYPKFDLEKTSHQDGPEHEIVFCNELVRNVDENENEIAARYNDLSLLGLRVLAGKDWTAMGQLSAYIKEGLEVERLIDDDNAKVVTPGSLLASTNNFAEIAFNLLVSDRLGAGKRIPRDTIDRDAMIIAAQFCRANGFRFDGVVGDRVNLREFIHTNAAFNLLDFTIVGGKFSLMPSVPYNPETFVIEPAQDITKSVKALFTDGNMKDMQVSFLPTQERQLFKATVAYRQEEENGFSSQRVTQMRFKDADGGSEADPEEFVDLTSFCTSPKHAKRIAEHKLLLRKHSEHNIQFKTTPSSALGLTAGDYIKVISNSSHTSRFNNGSVDQFGGVTSTTALPDGTHPVFFWRPGQEQVIEGQLLIEDGKTGDETFFKSIFTIQMENEQKRIYRVTSLTIDDEGFVDIGGAYQKLVNLTGDKKDENGNVVVDGNGDPVREVIGSALAILNPDNALFDVTD